MPPGTGAANSSNPAISQVPLTPAISLRWWWRHLVPAEGVEQPGGIAAEAAQQRLARRSFDRELANPAELAAVPVDEVEVENLGFAVEFAVCHLARQ